MSERQTIHAALERAGKRRRVDCALRGLWWGLLVGAVIWLVTLAAYKMFPIPVSALGIAGLAGVASVILGAVLGGWRKPSPQEVARWIDVKQNLKERLSTALEIEASPASEEWKNLLTSDAAQHAKGLDARRLLPLHLPVVARWSLLALLLGAGLGFVPEYRSKQYLQKQADAANIKDTGRQLAELTRRHLDTKPPTLEPTQQALEKIEELGQHLAKVSLTKADALKDLANVRDKLAEQARELGKNPALKPLEKAAREAGSSGAQSPEALQKQIDALQKSLGNGAPNDPGKFDQFKNDLDKAQQMAATLPDKDSPEGKAAREQLAQMLSNLAQQMKDAGLPLDSLEDALKALQAGNIDQFVHDMKNAANDLEKLSEMAKQLQSLQQQQAAAKMGKDLAEQLRQAQTDAAQATLQKMTEQLKAGQLSQEQLDRILDEVGKAIAPAGKYGKAGEHLKNAVKQMQQARQSNSASQQAQSKSDAAQSLAEAAKELDKLAQQMADAQKLSEMMAMLERAQQAIATGKGWGQCKTPGLCSACSGQGCFLCMGRGWKDGSGLNPRGVGTWAEETGWFYYQNVPQTPVDNSGVQRPDMEARPLSDRDNSLNSALSPTKVKGQMSPGGPMPSITLKGVAIKGQSRVDYEQAAAAAQAEAQSALNQDQVPRAYRGAVRDYFDDLKK